MEEVEAAIRPGGISKVKSRRIQAILRALPDDLDLVVDAHGAGAPSPRPSCATLPGVGRKTAACVLLFAYGLRDVPVDTHVGRVATRLALLRPGAGLGRAARRDGRPDPAGGRAGAPHEPAAPRPAHLPRPPARLPGLRSGAHVPEPAHMSRARGAELALVAIAAVWGLTFVMVQDAVERLAVTAFLGYRFVPAAALVAVVFRRELRQLSPAGWRLGLAMGAFLTAGYVLQTVGLQYTSASNAGFITGLFVVFTPLLGALVLRQRIGAVAWAAAGVSLLSGCSCCPGWGASCACGGDGLVALCAVALAAHILVTDRAVADHSIGALLAVQLGVCGLVCLGAAVATGDLEVPRGTRCGWHWS